MVEGNIAAITRSYEEVRGKCTAARAQTQVGRQRHRHLGPRQERTGRATIPEAGNSVQVNTGGWRSLTPVIDPEACDGCMLCYFYCPDASIIVEEGREREVDLMHCKGCGICAKECPTGAITMKIEEKE